MKVREAVVKLMDCDPDSELVMYDPFSIQGEDYIATFRIKVIDGDRAYTSGTGTRVGPVVTIE